MTDLKALSDAATPGEWTQRFLAALADCDRVRVEKQNALGEMDSHVFPARHVPRDLIPREDVEGLVMALKMCPPKRPEWTSNELELAIKKWWRVWAAPALAAFRGQS